VRWEVAFTSSFSGAQVRCAILLWRIERPL
jgi:hypothetical protein